MVDAVYVALLSLEEVVWHIKHLPDFFWLWSLILGSKLHIHWSIQCRKDGYK